MTRPTWSSVYSTYPANTSAIRTNRRFSSSLRDSHGRTVALFSTPVPLRKIERESPELISAMGVDASADREGWRL